MRNKKDDTWYRKRRNELSILTKQIYGAKKIFAILKEQRVKVSEKYARGVMEELGLQSIRTTSKKDFLKLNSKKRPDLLKQQFAPTRPNAVWVSDTTCFKIKGIWYYICAVLDLYSRKNIAYKISPKHSANLIFKTSKNFA